ncbi:MAG TPA: hypothetical protein VJV77_11400 [Casimicrobiaceae bacterium]|nr:hypothetical protein [Casimicrobiaceae bacterium]
MDRQERRRIGGERSHWLLIVRAAALALAAIFAAPALASFHLFRIDQVYSNAEGTIQFVVLVEATGSNGEDLWAGHELTSKPPNAAPRTFVFPTNLQSRVTARKRVLIATESFAALGIVTPDYVIPDRFLATTQGAVNFADVSELAYAALPTDGVLALNLLRQTVQNVATNFAGQSASVTAAQANAGNGARNYEGLWWNAPAESESGWGINFAHQGDIIFATWFTYDDAGKAWWLSMTADKTADATYSGTLYRTTGSAFNAVPFDKSKFTATPVGNGTLHFTDDNNGTFAYTVSGVTQTKPITRQAFGPLPKCTFGAQPDLALATNYQDLWWNAPGGSEDGWGVNFTHQGDTIFATWFTYGTDTAPLWLSATTAKIATRTYAGDIYRTTGPAFNAAPFLPANVKATKVGTLTLTFANGNAGTFDYTVDGMRQTKPITRQVFRSPGTVCQ